MAQNTSHAVMSQRHEPKDNLDDFPTPPWATRALLEHVIPAGFLKPSMSCLEPSCGAGHMAKVLNERFNEVHSSDIADYGYGDVTDFFAVDHDAESFDWVITNPPFKLAEKFVLRALSVARVGVAVLTRTVFIESVGRYNRVFKPMPPSIFAQFTERVPMVQGRLDKKASTATGYAWVVWLNDLAGEEPLLRWVPPCRKRLELADDYLDPPPPHVNVRTVGVRKRARLT